MSTCPRKDVAKDIRAIIPQDPETMEFLDYITLGSGLTKVLIY
jgi:hypothetical protein